MMYVVNGILVVTNLVFVGLYIHYLGKYHDRDMLAKMLRSHVEKLAIHNTKLKKEIANAHDKTDAS